MRMSCNGCRVLRKGCSESCSIRPCLQWIKRPESQANATVFLAKFYGRAGLLNLINAGSDHLRPAIFRSLLYEACGRILNPIFGSVGLLWSGSWGLCQAAVESVLKGDPIETIPSEATASIPAPPFKAHDIRHISREPCRRIRKCRPRFKRSGAAPKARFSAPEISGRHWCYESTENESMFSADTAEASHLSQGESHSDASEVCLDLSLGLSQSTSLDPGGHGVDLHLQLPP